MRNRIWLAAAAAALAAATVAVHAQEVRQQNGVSLVTGGIGEQAEARTRELGAGMGLQAVFARDDGAYLTGIDVTLKGRSGGTVLALDQAKPLLFADLPPGRYQLLASYDGERIERAVQVPKNGQRVEVLRWAR